MKKTLIAICLTVISTGSMAHSYFDDNKLTSKSPAIFEVSAAKYDMENFGIDKEDTGLKLGYERQTRGKLGYEASYETFKYNESNKEVDFQFGTVGLSYDIPLKDTPVTIEPALGIHHASLNDSSETSFYARLSVRGELIQDRLSAKAFYQHYDFNDGDLFDESGYGVKFNYHLNRDFDVLVGIEDTGGIKNVSFGLGLKF